MNEFEKTLKEAGFSLCDGIDQEILSLKHFMEGIDEDKFNQDAKCVTQICEKIFFTAEGLKKLADTLSFIDCWIENGEPPQLSQKGDLKEWQKEVMFSEGHPPY